MQQKLSLFQSLNSSPSRAVGMEEIVRLIRYDSDVANKTESYRKMASVLGKEKADEEVKRRIVPACSIGVLFDGNGRGAANVLGFTRLALCDIDGIEPQQTHPQPLPNGREAEYDSRRNCSGRSIRTPLPFGRGRGWV